MTLKDVLDFLLRRKLTLVGTFMLVVGLVTFFAYALPPGFRSEATVLVERTHATATPMTYAPNQQMVEILNTEAAIIKSRPVLEKVVDDLGLGNRVSNPKGAARVMANIRQAMINIGLTSDAPPREKWINRLERSVSVNPGIQSSVLTISYSTEDPRLAQAIVDAVTGAYLERRQEIFADQGLSAFYALRQSELEDNIARLRDELSVLRGTDSDPNNAADLRAELTRLRAELALRQADLEDVSARFLPGHNEVRSARAQVNYLQTAIARAENDLKTAASAAPGIEQLLIQISNEETSLRNIKAQYEAAVMSERSQSSFLDVRLVSPGSLPAKPTLSRLLMIFLGVTSGTVIAVMFAVIAEYFDDRTTDIGEVEALLQLPCVAILPQSKTISSLAIPMADWHDRLARRKEVPSSKTDQVVFKSAPHDEEASSKTSQARANPFAEKN